MRDSDQGLGITVERDAQTGDFLLEHRPTSTQMVIATPGTVGVWARHEDWTAALGVYALWFPTATGTGEMYAGTTTHRAVATRVQEHIAGMPGWQRSVMVRRAGDAGFHAGETRRLEAIFLRRLRDLEEVRVRNRQSPAEQAGPAWQERWLEEVIDIALHACTLTGMIPMPVPDAQPRTRQQDVAALVSVADLIACGDLVPGERLYPGWKPESVPPAVLNADGTHTWRGQTYTHISAAARLARGMKKTSGWQYWRVERGENLVPLGVLRDNYRDRRKVA